MSIRRCGRLGSAARGATLLAAVLCLGLVSCYPGTIEDLEEFDTVTTLYDTDEDFTGNQTYSMPDSIFHICDRLPEDVDCLTISRAFDRDVLNEVAEQMDALGYTRIAHDRDNPDEADLVLVASALAVQNITAWIDYWPCYPYYYYCYYPPTWTAVEYEVGTLLLTLVAPDRVNGENLAVVWVGSIRGVLDSANSNRTRVLDGIEQAFTQSPYLNLEGN